MVVRKNIKTVNEVEVTGRIVSIRKKYDDSAIVTIISKNGKDIFIRFFCSPGQLPDLKIHSMVSVKGHVNSHDYTDTYGKIHNSQKFIADEIKPEPTMVEQKFGVKGKFYNSFSCRVYLKGIVKSFIDDGEWIRYVIEVDGEKDNISTSNIKVSLHRLERQPEIAEGDILYIVGSLSTPKKEIEGETVYFENIIVMDIAVK